MDEHWTKLEEAILEARWAAFLLAAVVEVGDCPDYAIKEDAIIFAVHDLNNRLEAVRQAFWFAHATRFERSDDDSAFTDDDGRKVVNLN